MEAIQTKNLNKTFKDKVAVDGLNLTVHRGELYTLLGVNGAGKTTAIRMLTCLARPTSGEAKVCGYDVISEREKVKERIGVSPQETSVAPNLTVKENLRFFADLTLPKAEREKAVGEMIELFRLGEFEKKKAKLLSGGWQRQLSIAMALIGKPQVLFLDEPTLGLDVIARRRLWEVVQSLKGKMTILLTTHYMEEAEVLSDRVGVLARGKLYTEGTVEEIETRTNSNSLEEAFVAITKEAEQ
ncbi:MAG: ABC transporter ATP-binding protein [Clostridia bacterium]|nr:ABC transporter ATP-binding protein [Clostridia bacterium]